MYIFKLAYTLPHIYIDTYVKFISYVKRKRRTLAKGLNHS